MAMDGTEENNKLCNHCKKEVALLNFALHESHCQRFLSLCPDCNEPIPREQMEHHRSEQHTLVRCTQCNKKMERCHLQEHQSEECVGRMQLCRFCQLEVAFQDMEEHTVACSSRTERCADCGRYVQLRDQEDHALQCSASAVVEGSQDTAVPTDKQTNWRKVKVKQPTSALELWERLQRSWQDMLADFLLKLVNQYALEPKLVSSSCTQGSTLQLCFSCMKSFPSDKMWEHQRDCSASSSLGDKEDDANWQNSENMNSLVFTFSHRDSKALARSNMEDTNQIGTCLQCHLALPVATLQWHEVKCQAFEWLKKKDESKSPNTGDAHKRKSVLKW